MQPKYLIQDGTHVVYVYTETLAKRHDMRGYDPSDKPVVPLSAAVPVAQEAGPAEVPEAPAAPASETITDVTDVADLTTKADRLSVAIATLAPTDFTVGGAPKVEALEAALNENVTAAERDAAWALFQAAREG